jgi:hypothetical protein
MLLFQESDAPYMFDLIVSNICPYILETALQTLNYILNNLHGITRDRKSSTHEELRQLVLDRFGDQSDVLSVAREVNPSGK